MGHRDLEKDLTFGWLCNISRTSEILIRGCFFWVNVFFLILHYCRNKITGRSRPYLTNCFSKFFIICDNWITILFFDRTSIFLDTSVVWGSFLTHCVTNLFVNCLKERIIFLFSIYRQWPGKSLLILMTLENLSRMGYFCASKYFRSLTKTFLLCWQIFFSLNTAKECKDLKVQNQPHTYLNHLIYTFQFNFPKYML